MVWDLIQESQNLPATSCREIVRARVGLQGGREKVILGIQGFRVWGVWFRV